MKISCGQSHLNASETVNQEMFTQEVYYILHLTLQLYKTIKRLSSTIPRFQNLIATFLLLLLYNVCGFVCVHYSVARK